MNSCKKLILLWIVMVVGLTLSCRKAAKGIAQAPEIEWMKIYEKYFQGLAFEYAEKGGYVVVGETRTDENKRWYPFLLVTDIFGDSIWAIVLKEYMDGRGHDVKQLADGGYVIVGTINNAPREDDERIFCVRIDSIGNIIWQKTYGGDSIAYGNSVELTDDGFIIAGATSSFGYKKAVLYLLRIDRNGQKIWEKKYCEELRGEAKDIIRTSEGSFIVTGWIFVDGYNAYLAEVDNQGNCIWFKDYACEGGGWSVIETTDGGYAIIVDAKERSYIIRTDSIGNAIWVEAIGKDKSETRCISIEQTTDRGYIVTGAVHAYMRNLNAISGYSFFIAKTDSMGKTEWTKSLIEKGYGCGLRVRKTSDGGLILSGTKKGNACLIKLKPEE
jgi:hypothetical protein